MRRCQEAACAWPKEQVCSQRLEPHGVSCWPQRLAGRAELAAGTSRDRAGAGHLESILDALLLVGLGFSAGVEASAGSESVFFLQHAFSVTQSCPALCDPMDCSPPGSSAYGIFQARILEWVDMPSSSGSSQSRH